MKETLGFYPLPRWLFFWGIPFAPSVSPRTPFFGPHFFLQSHLYTLTVSNLFSCSSPLPNAVDQTQELAHAMQSSPCDSQPYTDPLAPVLQVLSSRIPSFPSFRHYSKCRTPNRAASGLAHLKCDADLLQRLLGLLVLRPSRFRFEHLTSLLKFCSYTNVYMRVHMPMCA